MKPAQKSPSVSLFVRKRQASQELDRKIYSWESEKSNEELDLRHWNYALRALRPNPRSHPGRLPLAK